MKDALYFNSMLTPKMITFIYWLLLLLVLFNGVVRMFATFQGITFTSFIMGLLTIIGGAIAARITCELLIVLFKIHDNVKTLASRPE
ncbi:MAG: hypothetical protein CL583_06330 [Alteromonadaceae bacterium]|nr:hypothetical protein [Alteromonadaceae bacterium]|tara:strand:- start:4239 stop:4499 length:261 start_codon:yes stop_codon:yes gene_type:complete